MKDKRAILITGASGFVGLNACDFFLKNGWIVYGLVDKGDVPNGVKKVRVDLLDFKKLKIEINKIKPSVILHLGAYVVLDRNYAVACMCIDVNIKGTLNLIEAVKNLPLKKFIFFSTEEVYGENRTPYKETQIPMPPSPYAVSKLAAENLCLLYHNLYNVPAVIMRIATIFGYHQPEARFIPGMMIKATKHEPLLLNSGKNKRDYLFIDSLLEAIDSAIKTKEVDGEIFNIGHSKSISGKMLAKKVVELSGSSSKIILNSFPDREGESKEWAMDNQKAKRILKWKANNSIDEDIVKTINFYKNKLS